MNELTILQILRGITQQNHPALVTIRRLVQNVHLEVRQFRHRLLEHLTQILHRQLQVLLVILKDLREIVPREIVCKRIRPFQRLPALLQSLRCCVEELHFDPRQARLRLETGHLLLCLEVQVSIQFRGLLVVGVAVVVV